jgi:hypothetical protein
MRASAIDITKRELRERGYTIKALVDDDEFRRVVRLLDEQPDVTDTPSEELRFIEGRLDLPMGHLDHFRITTTNGRGGCECGRVTTALDIVTTALVRQTHQYGLIRGALIGLRNTLEFADNGRQGECYACGRPVVAFSYWTNGYAYA